MESTVHDSLDDSTSQPAWPVDRIGLVLGPIALVSWLLWGGTEALTPEAHRLAGIMILTIIWWVTEPIPIAATGILAVSLAVILDAVPGVESGKVDAVRTVLAPFADPSVFFLLGGIFIGRAMTRHGLDRRLALSILCTRWAGRSPFTVLIAIGLAVTLVSMWISNTAATAMMYPVTLGIIAVLGAGHAQQVLSAKEAGTSVHAERASPTARGPAQLAGEQFARSPYATCLLLITAYASAIGGITTPIGTATNVVAMGYFKRAEYFGRPVDFLSWTAVGFPLMLLLFTALCVWFRLLIPKNPIEMSRLREYLRTEYSQLGRWKRGEVNTLVIFVIIVSFWIAPGVLAIFFPPSVREIFSRRFPEEIVAAMCPVLLFLAPVDWKARRGTLEPADFAKVDWGTILLFGAGLSLGGLMFKTGLADAIGSGVFTLLGSNNIWSITAIAVVGGILLSEFTSNAASATTLIPVTLSICHQAEVNPLMPLLGVTLAASFGSALPVSTPPNAIVYSSGLIPIRRMVVAGIGIDVLCCIAVWSALRIAAIWGWDPFR